MLILIWCQDVKKGIAKNGQIPWKNTEDMLFFKQQTLNQTVVMGKTTWNTLPFKPLKERYNVVLSRNVDESLRQKYPDVLFTNDVEHILALAKKQYVYIMGGKSLYEFFFPYADELIISQLTKDYDCDLYLDFSYENFVLKKQISKTNFTINFYFKK